MAISCAFLPRKRIFSPCPPTYFYQRLSPTKTRRNTDFTGVHTHDHLKMTVRDKEAILPRMPADLFPEYYPATPQKTH